MSEVLVVSPNRVLFTYEQSARGGGLRGSEIHVALETRFVLFSFASMRVFAVCIHGRMPSEEVPPLWCVHFCVNTFFF